MIEIDIPGFASLRRLGADSVVAIGNDRLMLDRLSPSVLGAIGLLRHPSRLRASFQS